MKITIDSIQRTVSLEGEATIQEVIDLLNGRLTEQEFNDYKLVMEYKYIPSTTIINYPPIKTNLPEISDIFYYNY